MSNLPPEMQLQINVIVNSLNAVIQEFLDRHKANHVCLEFHATIGESPTAVFLVRDDKFKDKEPGHKTIFVEGNDEIH
jgi:hypothetical protein